MRWTAPGTELAALATQPAMCLRHDAADRVAVRSGEALFNSAAMLGGQAAKMGLSCASCHANGRGNDHFQLAGVSDAPGTADVSHSFFSAARGNGRFDPVAIPDLAHPGKVPRDPSAAALEPFIRMLIVDEFSGSDPGPATLRALAAYVRAVGLCPNGDGAVPRQLGDQLVMVRGALDGAATLRDAQARRALLAAARRQLGLIAERYPHSRFPREQRALLAASRALQLLGDRASDRPDLAAPLAKWRREFDAGLAAQLLRHEAQSLYNSRNLGFVALQRDNR